METRIFRVLLDIGGGGARGPDDGDGFGDEELGRYDRVLTLKMNRARQATITTELMEIVSGAEALKG